MQFDARLLIPVWHLWSVLKANLARRPWCTRAVLGRTLASVGVAFVLGVVAAPLVHAGTVHRANHRVLTSADNNLLDQIQTRAVRFFVEQSDPDTGLTRDRARNHDGTSTAAASTAATGFALTAWCIADAHGWIPAGEARQRVDATLAYAADRLEQVHGWFYHFVDAQNGHHAADSEVSTIDTALFLQGAIFAREYLHDARTTELVNRIYRRIDWRWAENGRLTLTMGWKPDGGFLPYRWDGYCELMGMYLLGLGAPSRPLPWPAWDAFRRPRTTVAGRTFIECSPLFTHQYSHAWFNFRGVRDGYADYWQNSVDATLAQRAWSANQQSRYPHWSKNLWGLTASDGPHGYRAWGTPGPARDESDGTLVPCAPGGSLPFAPEECLADLRNMRAVGGARLWGRYGFADAFNPETNWVDPDVIGIDIGITLMMAENLRTGLVWNCFMRAPEVQRGMRIAGFRPEAPAGGRRVQVVATAKPAVKNAG